MEEEGGRLMVGRKCWEDVGVLASLEGREVSVNGTAERESDYQTGF